MKKKPKNRVDPEGQLSGARKPKRPKRRLIPFTAGKLPSVSKSMPSAASVVPLVSKEIPLVSASIPLVSATPTTTLARKWGLPRKEWGSSKIRATRKGEVKRPKDIGVFKFLGKVITAPYQPVEMVKGLTSAIHSAAQEEKDLKGGIEEDLLELKMRREMDEISEEDYKKKEARLKKKSKNDQRESRAKSREETQEEKEVRDG